MMFPSRRLTGIGSDMYGLNCYSLAVGFAVSDVRVCVVFHIVIHILLANQLHCIVRLFSVLSQKMNTLLQSCNSPIEKYSASIGSYFSVYMIYKCKYTSFSYGLMNTEWKLNKFNLSSIFRLAGRHKSRHRCHSAAVSTLGVPSCTTVVPNLLSEKGTNTPAPTPPPQHASVFLLN